VFVVFLTLGQSLQLVHGLRPVEPEFLVVWEDRYCIIVNL